MSSEPDPVVRYVEYLDKEMTLMGILSGFAVAGAALILDRTLSAEPDAYLGRLLQSERPAVLLSTVSLLGAGLYFYRQRSLLALYYGQLLLSRTQLPYMKNRTLEILEESDSWATWRFYQSGFVLLAAGFTYISLALIHMSAVPANQWLHVGIEAVPLALGIIIIAVVGYVTTKYKFNDEPWIDWWKGKPPDAATGNASTS